MQPDLTTLFFSRSNPSLNFFQHTVNQEIQIVEPDRESTYGDEVRSVELLNGSNNLRITIKTRGPTLCVVQCVRPTQVRACVVLYVALCVVLYVRPTQVCTCIVLSVALCVVLCVQAHKSSQWERKGNQVPHSAPSSVRRVDTNRQSAPHPEQAENPWSRQQAGSRWPFEQTYTAK